jgi:hypothetical protein
VAAIVSTYSVYRRGYGLIKSPHDNETLNFTDSAHSGLVLALRPAVWGMHEDDFVCRG